METETNQLTYHFTIDQLTRSDYAARNDLDNSPDPDIIENLKVLAQGLERVQDALGKPIRISSGYRSPKVNAGVGGSESSYHMKGLAADIEVDGMTPQEVCEVLSAAKDTVLFDKIIFEFKQWTHVQFPEPEDSPRLTAWTIRTSKEGYLSGIVA